MSMTAAQEAAFDKKAEKHFRSHRELPNGRDFRFESSRVDLYGQKGERAIDKFNKNFDSIFPNAPGSGI